MVTVLKCSACGQEYITGPLGIQDLRSTGEGSAQLMGWCAVVAMKVPQVVIG